MKLWTPIEYGENMKKNKYEGVKKERRKSIRKDLKNSLNINIHHQLSEKPKTLTLLMADRQKLSKLLLHAGVDKGEKDSED